MKKRLSVIIALVFALVFVLTACNYSGVGEVSELLTKAVDDLYAENFSGSFDDTYTYYSDDGVQYVDFAEGTIKYETNGEYKMETKYYKPIDATVFSTAVNTEYAEDDASNPFVYERIVTVTATLGSDGTKSFSTVTDTGITKTTATSSNAYNKYLTYVNVLKNVGTDSDVTAITAKKGVASTEFNIEKEAAADAKGNAIEKDATGLYDWNSVDKVSETVIKVTSSKKNGFVYYNKKDVRGKKDGEVAVLESREINIALN